MATTRELRVVLTAEDKASSVIDKTTKATTGMTSAFIKAQAIFEIARRAIQALGGAFNYLKESAFAAARIEELTYALRALAKANEISEDKIFATVEGLRSLNIAHREAMEAVALFIQNQLDLNDIMKLARAAQDLAVIGMMDSSDAFRTLTEAISSQQPILTRQFGIVFNLNDLYEEAGKRLGIVTERTTKTGQVQRIWQRELTESEKKQAFLNKILEEAAKVTGTYEAAMQSAGKQFRSLTGRIIPDFQVALGEGLLPILNVVITTLSDFFTSATTWLNENKDLIKGWSEDLIEKFGNVQGIIDFVKKKWEEFTRGFREGWERAAGSEILKVLQIGITDIRFAFKYLFDTVDQHPQFKQFLLDFVENMGIIIGAGFAGVIAAIAGALEILASVMIITTDALDDLLNGFNSLINYFRFTLEEGDYLNDFLTQLPTPIQGTIEAMGRLVAGIDSLVNYFRFTLEEGDYLNDFLAQLPTPIQGIIEIMGRLTVGIKGVIDYFRFLRETGDYMNDFAADVQRSLGDTVGGILMKIGELITKLISGFDELKTRLNIFQQMKDLPKWLQNIIPSFQFGGIVPGPPTQAVPAILHGGERVVSRHGADVGQTTNKSISINFYGGQSFQREQDMNLLVDKIKHAVGRDFELATIGAL